MMMGQEHDSNLNQPVYVGLMAISGIISVLGLALTVKGMGKGKD